MAMLLGLRRLPLELSAGSVALRRSFSAGATVPRINILKDGSDPASLPDSEYPAWLWGLVDKAPVRNADNLQATDGKLFFKKSNLTAIRKDNFLRDKKR